MSTFGLHLKRCRSNPFAGDRRAPPWLGSHYLHPFSPLFDATTIAHNAPSWHVIEAVISHSEIRAMRSRWPENNKERRCFLGVL